VARLRESRPVPRELAPLRVVRLARRLGFAAVALLLALVPGLLESRTNLAGSRSSTGIIALSLVVLTGWAGEISLGQMAFRRRRAAVGASITAGSGWDLASPSPARDSSARTRGADRTPVLRRRGLTLGRRDARFGLATTSWLLSRVSSATARGSTGSHRASNVPTCSA